MKILKILIVVVLIYVGIVVLFESLLGYFQPANQSTLIIGTLNAEGVRHDRVVARLESGGQVYVAANHWPRSWYRQTLANPAITASFGGETGNFDAIPVTGAEHDRVDADNSLGFVFRVLTGFPPRYFVRLDPR